MKRCAGEDRKDEGGTSVRPSEGNFDGYVVGVDTGAETPWGRFNGASRVFTPS